MSQSELQVLKILKNKYKGMHAKKYVLDICNTHSPEPICDCLLSFRLLGLLTRRRHFVLCPFRGLLLLLDLLLPLRLQLSGLSARLAAEFAIVHVPAAHFGADDKVAPCKHRVIIALWLGLLALLHLDLDRLGDALVNVDRPE
jgi:hypothetical protein